MTPPAADQEPRRKIAEQAIQRCCAEKAHLGEPCARPLLGDGLDETLCAIVIAVLHDPAMGVLSLAEASGLLRAGTAISPGLRPPGWLR